MLVRTTAIGFIALLSVVGALNCSSLGGAGLWRSHKTEEVINTFQTPPPQGGSLRHSFGDLKVPSSQAVLWLRTALYVRGGVFLLMLSLFKREYPKGEGVFYKHSSPQRFNSYLISDNTASILSQISLFSKRTTRIPLEARNSVLIVSLSSPSIVKCISPSSSTHNFF